MTTRRAVQWVDTIDRVNILPGSTTQTANLIGDETGLNRKGHTITRIVMNLTLRANFVDLRYDVSWGLTLVNSDAAAATAFPNPEDEDDQPGWLLRDVATLQTSDVDDGSQFLRMNYDIRAERLFRNQQQSLYFIIDQAASGNNLGWDLLTRVLVRLP